MAAGLGFKDFTTGEVLTAADVDGYLMQGIWVFADATARDAAVTSPQEGNFAFLKDTNVTTYYTGSAWTNLDTTGMVNPMTTTGDTIYSSSGSTPARLGIGTAGQVLQVNSGATAPEWATPTGGGGMTLLSTTTLNAVSTTISFTPTGYVDLYLRCYNLDTVNNANMIIRFNSDTSANYRSLAMAKLGANSPELRQSLSAAETNIFPGDVRIGGNANSNINVNIRNCNNTSNIMTDFQTVTVAADTNDYWAYSGVNRYQASAAITSITITNSNSETITGTALLYGVK
jgi:hypothetical protein